MGVEHTQTQVSSPCVSSHDRDRSLQGLKHAVPLFQLVLSAAIVGFSNGACAADDSTR